MVVEGMHVLNSFLGQCLHRWWRHFGSTPTSSLCSSNSGILHPRRAKIQGINYNVGEYRIMAVCAVRAMRGKIIHQNLCTSSLTGGIFRSHRVTGPPPPILRLGNPFSKALEPILSSSQNFNFVSF